MLGPRKSSDNQHSIKDLLPHAKHWCEHGGNAHEFIEYGSVRSKK
jgi:hypothetical protein